MGPTETRPAVVLRNESGVTNACTNSRGIHHGCIPENQHLRGGSVDARLVGQRPGPDSLRTPDRFADLTGNVSFPPAAGPTTTVRKPARRIDSSPADLSEVYF
jgi:hypothetical protein